MHNLIYTLNCLMKQVLSSKSVFTDEKTEAKGVSVTCYAASLAISRMGNEAVEL